MFNFLPNLITLSRILLGLAASYQILRENWSLALQIFLLAAFTDYLDGTVAKLLHRQSKLAEKVLEPLSDAVMIIAALTALNHLYHFLNWWIAIPLTILMLTIYSITKIWEEFTLGDILTPLFSIAYGVATVSISLVLASRLSPTTKWLLVLFYAGAAWWKRKRIRELLFPASVQRIPRESNR
ncbi:MAG: CDP-alcohol phosphatidyltransferase family protein [Actinomycetota bacterium]|nr:CDP-alcohol phosphatidyltransferase family protein [Actinomycetota bacterium]